VQRHWRSEVRAEMLSLTEAAQQSPFERKEEMIELIHQKLLLTRSDD
jgi:hypothetical protein